MMGSVRGRDEQQQMGSPLACLGDVYKRSVFHEGRFMHKRHRGGIKVVAEVRFDRSGLLEISPPRLLTSPYREFS